CPPRGQEPGRGGPRGPVRGAGLLCHRAGAPDLDRDRDLRHRRRARAAAAGAGRPPLRPPAGRHHPPARPAPPDLQADRGLRPLRERRHRCALGAHRPGRSPASGRRSVGGALAGPEVTLRARVFDTRSRRLVRLPTSEDERGDPLFRLYVCGITPYDSGHMGHAFTFCAFDVLARFVEAGGVPVRYVQNVTDVDDPLFERARRDAVDWKQLAEREQEQFVRDMDALGWRRPDVMPRVSEEIPGILDAVRTLDAGGYA